MILTLVREQVRAQRTALIWSALVVAAAVGFSTYASVAGATDAAIDQYRFAVSPGHAANGAYARLTDLGSTNGGSDEVGTPTTSADLATQLAKSNDSGSDAWATATWWGTLKSADESGAIASYPYGGVTATWGATPWEHILAEGRAPLTGEIAIPAGVARDLHVGIGDAIRLSTTVGGEPGPTIATPTVSGLTYDMGGLPWMEADVFISSADAALLTELNPMPGPSGRYVTATIGWSETDSSLNEAWATGWESRGGSELMQTGAPAPWLVALTLTIGAVIMAFAVGRTQAAMRVQWTATARALGARRSHLLGAGAVEALALFAAGLVGIVLGTVAAHAEHAVWRRSLAAAPPVSVSFPWWLLAALLGLALVLAVTSAAIPAVLATRVPPTAALKATSVTDEQELSRRVRVLPVGIGLGLAWIALLLPFGSHPELGVLWIALAFAGIALLIAFVIEMARRGAESVGNRWQRSARPWQIYAGTMLGGHPRQAGALASIYFFALFGVAGWMAMHGESAMRVWAWLIRDPASRRSWRFVDLLASAYGIAVIGILLAVAMLCAAIITSSFKASSAESQLAGALGLEPQDLRRAHAATWAAAQAVGGFAGALAGTVLVGGVWASQTADNAWGLVTYQADGRLAALGMSIGAAIVAGILAALLSAGIAAWSNKATRSIAGLGTLAGADR